MARRHFNTWKYPPILSVSRSASSVPDATRHKNPSPGVGQIVSAHPPPAEGLSPESMSWQQTSFYPPIRQVVKEDRRPLGKNQTKRPSPPGRHDEETASNRLLQGPHRITRQHLTFCPLDAGKRTDSCSSTPTAARASTSPASKRLRRPARQQGSAMVCFAIGVGSE